MSAPRRSGRTSLPARSGDEEELFRHHHERLVRLVEARLAVSRELAEDACSLAWLQLLRLRPPRANLLGWLYTVAKHETFALLRRQRAEAPVGSVGEAVAEVHPLDALEAKKALGLLAQLKRQQRLALWLRAEGYSYKQIEAATGKSSLRSDSAARPGSRRSGAIATRR
jgi:DNA-directed RNA polymerase specialized sigma24 family protein